MRPEFHDRDSGGAAHGAWLLSEPYGDPCGGFRELRQCSLCRSAAQELRGTRILRDREDLLQRAVQSGATLPQTTLLDYLVALGDRTLLARSVKVLGFYPVCKDADAGLLMGHVKEMNALTSKINELKDAKKSKDATLADTSSLLKVRFYFLCMRAS